jgi:hypothetical protein
MSAVTWAEELVLKAKFTALSAGSERATSLKRVIHGFCLIQK